MTDTPAAQQASSRIIEMAEFPDPAAYGKAIVFVNASWSISAKNSFARLIEAVESGLDESWPVIVLDTNTIQDKEFWRTYGPFPSTGGWGETFWIKEGKVIYSDRGYYNASLAKLLWRRIKEFAADQKLVIPDTVASDDSFAQSVLRNCGALSPEQIQICELDCPAPGELDRAIVYLYDVSMAQTLKGLRALGDEMRSEQGTSAKLMVINSAGVAFADMMRNFGEMPEAGKTYWVVDGKCESKGFWMAKAKN